ncbi:hypothetical protein [Kordia sp.]|uniref:hypothetical protein n=1 Tax=Kordia sp. TaxID=1965332 RepID=UPI003B59D055
MKTEFLIEEQTIKTPGIPIASTITVSSPVEIYGNYSSNEQILLKISDHKTKDLFPPTVTAYEEKDRKIINVNAMILFPFGEIDKNKFQVTQQHVYGNNGDNQLNFYISYRTSDVCTNQYIPTLISFQSNSVINILGESPKIKTVQTFFSNLDPVTSRGTVTTVKKPM